MTPEEFRTVRITPASATKRKRFARKRSEELAAIQADGWEIVDIEPERLLRPGDKVTVKRPGSAKPAFEPVTGRSWWLSLDQRGKAAVGLGLIAVIVLIAGIGTML
jgi:hypothetical protein